MELVRRLEDAQRVLLPLFEIPKPLVFTPRERVEDPDMDREIRLRFPDEPVTKFGPIIEVYDPNIPEERVEGHTPDAFLDHDVGSLVGRQLYTSINREIYLLSEEAPYKTGGSPKNWLFAIRLISILGNISGFVYSSARESVEESPVTFSSRTIENLNKVVSESNGNEDDELELNLRSGCFSDLKVAQKLYHKIGHRVVGEIARLSPQQTRAYVLSHLRYDIA